MTARLRPSLPALLLAVPACLLPVCGGEPPEDPCRPRALERITDGQVEHACLHTELGPFQDVDAVRVADWAGAPELRNTHTAYRVRLPRAGTDDASRSGVVRLRPRVAGVHALYLDVAAPVTVTEATDPEAGPLCVLEARAGDGCAGLAEARSFRLQRQRDYRVELGPTRADTVLVVLEQLSESP